jgi:hypothetical protein
MKSLALVCCPPGLKIDHGWRPFVLFLFFGGVAESLEG